MIQINPKYILYDIKDWTMDECRCEHVSLNPIESIIDKRLNRGHVGEGYCLLFSLGPCCSCPLTTDNTIYENTGLTTEPT